MSHPHPPVTPAPWPLAPTPSFAGWVPPAPKPAAPAAPETAKPPKSAPPPARR